MNSITEYAKKNLAAEIVAENVRIFVQIKNAFDQCDPEIQNAIVDMIDICRDESATDDEKRRAMDTIVEALFPSLTVDILNYCEGLRNSKEGQARSREMEEEERTFAVRVQAVMTQKGITQEELAASIGVGQSAISNMLNRRCRPQKRTISRIASALSVPVEELWPTAGNQFGSRKHENTKGKTKI